MVLNFYLLKINIYSTKLLDFCSSNIYFECFNFSLSYFNCMTYSLWKGNLLVFQFKSFDKLCLSSIFFIFLVVNALTLSFSYLFYTYRIGNYVFSIISDFGNLNKHFTEEESWRANKHILIWRCYHYNNYK